MKIGCSRLKYASDKTIKEKLEIWFIKDHSKAIKFRIFTTLLKVASCVLYIVEVLTDPLAIYYSSTSSNPKRNPNWLVANVAHSPPPSSSLHNSGENATMTSMTTTTTNQDLQDDIDWNNIFFVRRHPIVRNFQVAIAFYGLFESLFYFYLCYNSNFLEKIKNAYFYIEILCTVPWIVEFLLPRYSKDIFIPVFLNCWLIKRNLNYIFKDFNNINIKHHNSVIGQHLISLGTLFFCLIFTSVCGFQHLQRANLRDSISLFDSLYYIIITFSTVGYGDITPNTWPSKIFMAVMIIVALIVIPTQLEHLASLWFERQNLGASYSSHRAANEKHIVVCSTTLTYDLIIDFLHEFYAHRKNHNIHAILLSSSEMDIQLRSLLHTPLWKQRVFYIHGSALRDSDLGRAKVHQAKAVFIIASRGIDKDLADQHSILRSWAIKDFAPHTPQFVQLFRPENKINLKFAEFLVCEDEFKYALLANNCLCPGISTLVTLLLHKSKLTPGKEVTPEDTSDDWQNIYSKLAGNEIHSITAETSKFFQEFIGKTFVHASCVAHKKYNVCLIGIGKDRKQTSTLMMFDEDGTGVMDELILASRRSSSVTSKTSKKSRHASSSNSPFNRCMLLNPGPLYEIEAGDICYYISLVKEENYNWKGKSTKSFAMEELYQSMMVDGPELSMRTKAAERAKAREESADRNFNVLEAHAGEFSPEKSSSNFESMSTQTIHSANNAARKNYNDIRASDLLIGRPPNPLYIGCNPTLCKLLKSPSYICCLELNRECEHKTNAQASDYKWRNKCILVVAECATNGLFNFILPLRAQVRSVMFLRPIVLLLENTPSVEFLEAISPFPLVYWMKGSISNLGTILKAGIMDSETVVVVSPEKHAKIDDDSLTDCSNIVSVQNLYRLFPKIKVVAELTKASNIRFMKFRAKEMLREEENDDMDVVANLNSMGYMLRQPFAAGNVFSASMMDTLLYQTFGKPYLIELIRLLIGISQTPGSGNLTSIPLTENDMWIKTYGNLYKKLTSTTGEIPIGLYRTRSQHNKNKSYRSKFDIQQMILIKMNKLGIDPDKYKSYDEHLEKFSYVLINPSHDYMLRPGDIIYLLKPGASTISKSISDEPTSEGQTVAGVLNHYLPSMKKEPTVTTTTEAQPKRTSLHKQTAAPPQPPPTMTVSAHLSIDETWLGNDEEPIDDDDDEYDGEGRSKVPKTFESLKRMFLPSSIVSLRGSTRDGGGGGNGVSAGTSATDNSTAESRGVSASASGVVGVTAAAAAAAASVGEENEEERELVLKGASKVRSKSLAVPTVSTHTRRGKISKLALRKLFYNRNKPSPQDDSTNNTSF